MISISHHATYWAGCLSLETVYLNFRLRNRGNFAYISPPHTSEGNVGFLFNMMPFLYHAKDEKVQTLSTFKKRIVYLNPCFVSAFMYFCFEGLLQSE